MFSRGNILLSVSLCTGAAIGTHDKDIVTWERPAWPLVYLETRHVLSQKGSQRNKVPNRSKKVNWEKAFLCHLYSSGTNIILRATFAFKWILDLSILPKKCWKCWVIKIKKCNWPMTFLLGFHEIFFKVDRSFVWILLKYCHPSRCLITHMLFMLMFFATGCLH